MEPPEARVEKRSGRVFGIFARTPVAGSGRRGRREGSGRQGRNVLLLTGVNTVTCFSFPRCRCCTEICPTGCSFYRR